MSFIAFAGVLLAALLHAAWNALIKSAGDKLLTTIAVALAAGSVAALVLPWVAQPAAASWPFIAVSALLTIVYFVMVARIYHLAELSQRYWRLGLAGGIGSLFSYGLALWAMTAAPIATVAALRETSIVFGTLIAWLWLHERVGARRLVAACIIAGGAIALRVS